MKRLLVFSAVLLSLPVLGQGLPPVLRNPWTTNSNGAGLTNVDAASVGGTAAASMATKVYVDNAVAGQPVIQATNTAASTQLLLTNDLGVATGFRVYNPNTNTVALSQVSRVAVADSNQLVRVSIDRIAWAIAPLESLYTDGGWPHSSLNSKTFTNNGLGIASGASFISTANVAAYFTNTGAGYWTAHSATGGTYTNSVLLAATNTYVVTSGSSFTGTVWGQTNWFWLQPTNGSFYLRKSDGVTVWETNVITGAW